jgi:hypothetical protein
VEQIVRLIKGEISNHLQRIGPRHYAEFIRWRTWRVKYKLAWILCKYWVASSMVYISRRYQHASDTSGLSYYLITCRWVTLSYVIHY